MRKKVLGLVAGLGLSVLASGVSFAYWTDHLKVNVDVPIFYQADISIKATEETTAEESTATENTATVESSATTEELVIQVVRVLSQQRLPLKVDLRMVLQKNQK